MVTDSRVDLFDNRLKLKWIGEKSVTAVMWRLVNETRVKAGVLPACEFGDRYFPGSFFRPKLKLAACL